MKTLSIIIAAALVSGAAYGQETDFMRMMREQEQARQVHEQLEEIQAQQRHIRAAQEEQEYRWQQQQCEPRHFWLTPLDLECE